MSRRPMSRRSTLAPTLAVLAIGATTAVFGPASAASAADSQVSVVHGIPGTPVDVYVNDKLTLDDFQPNTVTDPLSLPAGTYTVKVFPADAPDATGSPVIEATADVPADANLTLVAHLKADGSPTITPYANDVSMIPAGQGRVIVRHDAAAPAVDVRANGTVIVPGLVNPKEAALETAAGTVSADVVLAGTDTVAIGPADLTVSEGTTTIVYAVGSAADKTLGLLVQTIGGMGSNPNGAPAGSGGLASTATPAWAWPLAAAGLLAALGSAAALRRQSSARSEM